MRITILGSGTCVPSLRRSSCAVMIEINNTKILCDCGPGTMRRLLETGTTIFDISFIFLSHFHPDHSGELVPLLFSNKYAGINQRRMPLTLIGGKGLSAFYDKLKAVYGHWIELDPDLFNCIELENTELSFPSSDLGTKENFTVASIPVQHNPESLAYRITANDVSVVYSGDTDYSDNLVKLAKNADLLICESAFPDELKASGHLTPSLAGKIATLANVRKLVLIHFYPECEQANIENQCRKTYDGSLVLAEDLMELGVGS